MILSTSWFSLVETVSMVAELSLLVEQGEAGQGRARQGILVNYIVLIAERYITAADV